MIPKLLVRISKLGVIKKLFLIHRNPLTVKIFTKKFQFKSLAKIRNQKKVANVEVGYFVIVFDQCNWHEIRTTNYIVQLKLKQLIET